MLCCVMSEMAIAPGRLTVSAPCCVSAGAICLQCRSRIIPAAEFADRFHSIFASTPGNVKHELFIQMALLLPQPAKRLELLKHAQNVSGGLQASWGTQGAMYRSAICCEILLHESVCAGQSVPCKLGYSISIPTLFADARRQPAQTGPCRSPATSRTGSVCVASPLPGSSCLAQAYGSLHRHPCAGMLPFSCLGMMQPCRPNAPLSFSCMPCLSVFRINPPRIQLCHVTAMGVAVWTSGGVDRSSTAAGEDWQLQLPHGQAPLQSITGCGRPSKVHLILFWTLGRQLLCYHNDVRMSRLSLQQAGVTKVPPPVQ